MTTGNGERISDRVGQAFRDYDAACDDRARTAALKDCVYALTQSVQSIYRRLPKRPWIWQAVQSLGLVAIIGGAVWFGSFQTSVRAETAQATKDATEAKAECKEIKGKMDGLSATLLEVVVTLRERNRLDGIPPPSPETKRAVARSLGLPPPADTLQP
jgi:hypothetical protein